MNAVAERPRATESLEEPPRRVPTADRRPRLPGTARGLIVGQDPEFTQFVADLLGGSVDIRATTSPQVALGLLNSREWELIVIEHTEGAPLPLSTLIRHVRAEHPRAAVVVTSQAPLLNQQVVECFRADADDYVAAPFHPSEFDARVGRLLRRNASCGASNWPASAPDRNRNATRPPHAR